jgi:hypothetical protein
MATLRAYNPDIAAGRTVTYVSVAQGAAGTTVLAVAEPDKKHKLLGGLLVMSATGTLKFTSGSTELSGPMDIVTNGGFTAPPSNFPYTETLYVNQALNLVTTVGKANGFVVILTE